MSRRNDPLSRLAKYALFVAIVLLCSRASAADGTSRTILDTSGFWRIHYMLRPPVVQTAAGLQTVEQPRCLWLNRDTTPPPDDWRSVEFDDSSWWRSPGAVFPVRRLEWLKRPDLDFGFSDLDYSTVYLSHLAMRGKFAVPDPARAGDLSLSLAYRGGAVVYLNGKEVARAICPKAKSARHPGQRLPAGGVRGGRGEAALGRAAGNGPRPLRAAQSRAQRTGDPGTSSAEGRQCPGDLGTPAAHHAVVLAHQVAEKKPFLLLWSTCGLSSVPPGRPRQRSCPTTPPAGIAGVEQQPFGRGFRLGLGRSAGKALRDTPRRRAERGGFRQSRARRQRARAHALGQDRRPGVERGRHDLRRGRAHPLRGRRPLGERRVAALSGGRHGLRRAGGTPPAEVEVRVKKAGRGNWILPGQPPHVDGAVQPVWITVRVPADARPGDYAGNLDIAAGGQTFRVPVELHVCGWRMPDPQHFASFCELIQSPETPALKYNVPFWSEQHFALIGRSLSFLGQVGSPTTYLPVVCRTNMGNDYSLVRWIRQPGRRLPPRLRASGEVPGCGAATAGQAEDRLYSTSGTITATTERSP